MKNASTLFILLLCYILAQPCFAQEDGNSDDEGIYGYSSLEILSDTSIVGYVETDLDASVGSYYSARVWGQISDANNNTVAYGVDNGCDGCDIAEVTLEYDNATPNTTYTLTGHHSGMVEISDPCDGCHNNYMDYFDYQFYSSLMIDAPEEYEYAPQGPPQHSPEVINLGSTHETVQATTPGACNDERDQIIKEYSDLGVGYSPTCNDFTQTASTAHFTFNELNTGDYTWAILQQSLLDGSESVRSNNGDVGLIVNSAYRNPKRNARVGGELNSRHQFGDAIDFNSDNTTWQGLHDAGKQASGCVEPVASQGGSHAHCHIDWRGTCPRGW